MAQFAMESLKHPMLQPVEDIEEKVGIKCLVVRLDQTRQKLLNSFHVSSAV